MEPLPDRRASEGAFERLSRALLRAELIGRERELAQLQEALAEVRNGHGRMVSLTECESRSKAMNTATVPYSREAKPSASQAYLHLNTVQIMG